MTPAELADRIAGGEKWAVDIHSCGYHCEIPACMKAQRLELLAKLAVAEAAYAEAVRLHNSTLNFISEFDAHQELTLVATERDRWHSVLSKPQVAPKPLDNSYDYIEADFALRLAAAAARVKAHNTKKTE